MGLIVLTIYVLTEFSRITGVIIGVLSYLYFGVQPRILGWILALVTLVLAWRVFWLENALGIVAAVNLGFIALLSFYFQMRDEEENPLEGETDSIRIHVVPYHFTEGSISGPLSKWVIISVGIYSTWAGLFLVFMLLNWRVWDLTVFSCLAAMSTALMNIRMDGGSKGRVFSAISDAMKTKGGLIPRPDFN